jgi:hypothetical protein
MLASARVVVLTEIPQMSIDLIDRDFARLP